MEYDKGDGSAFLSSREMERRERGMRKARPMVVAVRLSGVQIPPLYSALDLFVAVNETSLADSKQSSSSNQ